MKVNERGAAWNDTKRKFVWGGAREVFMKVKNRRNEGGSTDLTAPIYHVCEIVILAGDTHHD